VGSSKSSCGEQSSGLLELGARGGTEETVVTDLGKAARQSVQQEAADKLISRKGDTV